VDTVGNYLAYDGTSWTAPRRISVRAQGTVDVACGSPTLCITVDERSKTWVYDGSRWTLGPASGLPAPPSRGSSLGYLTCGSATFCMMVSDGLAATFNGISWSQPVRFQSKNGQEWAVSCSAARLCGVVSYRLAGWTLRVRENGSWQPQILLPNSLDAPSITCAGRDFCMLPNFTGYVATYDAGVVSAVTRPTLSALGASCLTPSFCVLDAYEQAFIWNGDTFDDGHFVTNDRLSDDSDISCVKPHFCAAVGLFGAVVGT
jgi:hypothetical protein